MEKEAERGRNKRGKKVFLESIEALSDPFSSPSIGIDLRRNTRAIGVDAESIKKGGVEREREREKILEPRVERGDRTGGGKGVRL